VFSEELKALVASINELGQDLASMRMDIFAIQQHLRVLSLEAKKRADRRAKKKHKHKH
jgi:uncharacterized protein (UPF0335 family)